MVDDAGTHDVWPFFARPDRLAHARIVVPPITKVSYTNVKVYLKVIQLLVETRGTAAYMPTG